MFSFKRLFSDESLHHAPTYASVISFTVQPPNFEDGLILWKNQEHLWSYTWLSCCCLGTLEGDNVYPVPLLSPSSPPLSLPLSPTITLDLVLYI